MRVENVLVGVAILFLLSLTAGMVLAAPDQITPRNLTFTSFDGLQYGIRNASFICIGSDCRTAWPTGNIQSIASSDAYIVVANGTITNISANLVSFDARYALVSSLNAFYVNVSNLQTSNTSVYALILQLGQNDTNLNASINAVDDRVDSLNSSKGNVSSTNGSSNYVAVFDSSTGLRTGSLYDNGTAVGIGALPTRANLEVRGNLTVMLGANQIAQLNDATNGSAIWGMNGGFISENALFRITATGINGNISFHTQSTRNSMIEGTEHVRITTAGNLGVNTTWPNNTLTVVGEPLFVGNTRVADDNTGQFTKRSTLDVVNSGGTVAMSIMRSNTSYINIFPPSGTPFSARLFTRTSLAQHWLDSTQTGTTYSLGDTAFGSDSLRPVLFVDADRQSVGVNTNATFENFTVTGNVSFKTGSNSTYFYASDANGRIGINTSAPINTLTVVGGASFSDRVGVNTTAPDRALSVVGDVGINTSTDKGGLNITNTFAGRSVSLQIIRPGSGGVSITTAGGTPATAQIGVTSSSGTESFPINLHSATSGDYVHGDMTLGPSGAGTTQPTVFISAASDQQVGFNTSSPNATLHVVGTIKANNVTVDQNLTVSGYMTTPGICLNGDCKTAWPTGSGTGNISGGGTATQFAMFNATSTINGSPMYLDGSIIVMGATTADTGAGSQQLLEVSRNGPRAQITINDNVGANGSRLHLRSLTQDMYIGMNSSTGLFIENETGAFMLNLSHNGVMNVANNISVAGNAVLTNNSSIRFSQIDATTITTALINTTAINSTDVASAGECLTAAGSLDQFTWGTCGSGGGGNVTSSNGTAGYHARFTNSTNVATGALFDNGTHLSVGTIQGNATVTIQSTNNVDDFDNQTQYHLVLRRVQDTNGADVGMGFVDSSNAAGSTVGSAIVYTRAGSNGFGNLSFWTKPSGSNITRRLIIDANGSINITGLGSCTTIGSFGGMLNCSVSSGSFDPVPLQQNDTYLNASINAVDTRVTTTNNSLQLALVNITNLQSSNTSTNTRITTINSTVAELRTNLSVLQSTAVTQFGINAGGSNATISNSSTFHLYGSGVSINITTTTPNPGATFTVSAGGGNVSGGSINGTLGCLAMWNSTTTITNSSLCGATSGTFVFPRNIQLADYGSDGSVLFNGGNAGGIYWVRASDRIRYACNAAGTGTCEFFGNSMYFAGGDDPTFSLYSDSVNRSLSVQNTGSEEAWFNVDDKVAVNTTTSAVQKAFVVVGAANITEEVRADQFEISTNTTPQLSNSTNDTVLIEAVTVGRPELIVKSANLNSGMLLQKSMMMNQWLLMMPAAGSIATAPTCMGAGIVQGTSACTTTGTILNVNGTWVGPLLGISTGTTYNANATVMSPTNLTYRRAGFDCTFSFITSTAVGTDSTGQNIFMGLSQHSPQNFTWSANYTTANRGVGFLINTNTTNGLGVAWHAFSTDSTTHTAINTTINLTQGNVYVAKIAGYRGDNQVYYWLRDLNTSREYNGTISTNLPSLDAGMRPGISVTQRQATSRAFQSAGFSCMHEGLAW